jgi:hypothetical protein
MVIDGLFGHKQAAGDLGIATPLGEQCQDLQLPPRQLVRILLGTFVAAAGMLRTPRSRSLRRVMPAMGAAPKRSNICSAVRTALSLLHSASARARS